MSTRLKTICRTMSGQVQSIRFTGAVAYVYNPLDYAWPAYEEYLERYGEPPRDIVLVGMNPGPWGMAQTGVPFGEVSVVRDWLKIDVKVRSPAREHPKRLVKGLACTRSEVSGKRLWGWAQRRYGTPEKFFSRFFVANYCPLMFLEESGRNVTPDKLPVAQRDQLMRCCDQALLDMVDYFKPRYVVGIGQFVEARLLKRLADRDLVIGRITHPSPANPQANKSWEPRIEQELRNLGIEP